jgi:hypothetical protein
MLFSLLGYEAGENANGFSKKPPRKEMDSFSGRTFGKYTGMRLRGKSYDTSVSDMFRRAANRYDRVCKFLASNSVISGLLRVGGVFGRIT